MTEQNFLVNDWLVEPSLGQVSNRGTVVRLEPQVMNVLCYLAEQAPEVVTKQQLVENVWRRKFASDAALSRSIFALRRAFGDDSKQPTFLQTVPKIGYRLVASVSKPLPTRKHFGRVRAAGLFSVAIASALVLISTSSAHRPSSPVSSLQIVQDHVQPDSMERDEVRFLHAVSRAFDSELEDQLIPVKNAGLIADENADYILRRSVGVRGEVATVDLVLLDSRLNQGMFKASVQIREMKDFAQVEDIVDSVYHSLGAYPEKSSPALRHDWPTQDVVAYDSYLRGKKSFEEYNEPDNQNAIALFEAALELDQDFALAHAALAVALVYESRYWGGNRNDQALLLAMRSLELDPESAESHFALGEVLSATFETRDRALLSFEQALALNPLHAGALKSSAWIHGKKQNVATATALYEQVIDVYPDDYYAMKQLGSLLFQAGDLDTAYFWLAKAAQDFPLSIAANSQLAILEILNGEYDAAVERCERVNAHVKPSRICVKVSAAASILSDDLATAQHKYLAMQQLWPGDEYGRLGQAYLMRVAGEATKAGEIIDEVLRVATARLGEDYCPPRYYHIAASASSLQGNHSRAMELLLVGNRNGLRYDPWLEVDPLLEELRSDKRFNTFIAATKPIYKAAMH